MRFVRLNLNGGYREIGSQVAGLGGAGMGPEFRYDHFLERVEWLVRRKRIERVLIVRGPQFAASAFGALEGIRAGLMRLKQAGKELVYYAADYETADCYLAAACDVRVMHPLGSVSFRGLSASGMFFRNLMDRHGIGVEIIRRGRYKSAADPFRTDHFDAWSREQLQRLLDANVDHMRTVLHDAPGFGPQRIEAMLSGAGYHATEAQEAGVVHQLSTLDDLLAAWKSDKLRIRKPPKLKGRWGRGKRVALLVFEGGIIDGRSRREPMLGQLVGDESFIARLRAVREDKKTKAVVLRINSGGGSATASDSIVRELERLAETKPLIVSMGPVAGSGGYWIATAGKRLIAQATTITGSIGVIAMFLQLQQFLERYGITADSVRRGDMADITTTLRPMTEQERAAIDARIERLYQDFLQRSARFRGTTPERIHELGEGHLWIGTDAVEKGLVDATGGVFDALELAAAEIGARRVRVSTGPHIKQPWLARMLARQEKTVAPLLSAAAGVPVLPPCDTAQLPGMTDGLISGLRICSVLHGKAWCVDPLLLALQHTR
ncbi:signal peptide peptidase SppA [Spirochaeta africana]|uniref:Signal peptide peptidase SppA, 36K type n=1 Tax=Spirochaeta africana (strain ATCC 700263 / DSM 8902 / Z-7692) TaxID=889378 RepID=H9UID9_SPIAZ|nr:signal peptide peptidase SppA [Spirochaeta africana]AFG37282.1 signal peptide peptidase SppA, 36K type [Spirochaeta africana DSM 8902]